MKQAKKLSAAQQGAFFYFLVIAGLPRNLVAFSP